MSNGSATNTAQVAESIKQFITESFLHGRTDVVLTNDARLIEQGVIDSMGIFRLITFLEGAFGHKLDLAEIQYENFETIDAIAALIIRNAKA
ncbi:MAG TPA: acyl carrier protein [Polyangium sp.]|nr:acyl carrier protein [Polyangium sp.]